MDNNKNKQEQIFKGTLIDCATAWKRLGCRKSEPQSTIAYFVIGKGCKKMKVVHRGEE